MRYFAALLAGLIFGVGLLISGMTNPAKVLNFLDVAGYWDPSLLFVMGGAIAVGLPGYRLATKRPLPIFAEKFSIPTKTDLDIRLLSGAAVFGIGWGLGGLCPGPAITSVLILNPAILTFVLTMLAGMWIAVKVKS